MPRDLSINTRKRLTEDDKKRGIQGTLTSFLVKRKELEPNLENDDHTCSPPEVVDLIEVLSPEEKLVSENSILRMMK